MFHKHQWSEVERRYYSPAPPSKVSGIMPEQLNFLIYGRTIITNKCDCGKRSQDNLLGRVEK